MKFFCNGCAATDIGYKYVKAMMYIKLLTRISSWLSSVSFISIEYANEVMYYHSICY